MRFVTNIAVEQEVIMATIMIAFLHIYTPADAHQHKFN